MPISQQAIINTIRENTKLIGKLSIIIERQNKKIVELESKVNLLIKLNEENEKDISRLTNNSTRFGHL